MGQEAARASCGSSMYMAPLYRYMEETQRNSNIRYVDVYTAGKVVKEPPPLPQGFGTLLMEEAERIAKEEHGSVKIAVISGKLGNVRKAYC